MNEVISPAPLVSIITIVYNGEKSIERAIKSIADQTYPHIEYIVIDGGSKDRTVEILKKWNHKISHWVSEPDRGIADAFNKGVRVAKGSIIGFVNSDDWYNPDTVEKIVPYFKSFDVVYGDVQFWKDGKKAHRTFATHTKLKQGMSLAHPAVFVAADIYRQVGLFNIECRICMDYEFMLRVFLRHVRFRNINEIIVNMQLGGLSDKYWMKAFKEERAIKAKYIGQFMAGVYFARQVLLFSTGKLLRLFNKKEKV
jgi:glycosyltransferase involved in cell wall biosynthesis